MFKTTSGKEVELKPVSLAQHIECEDASSIGYDPTGGVVVHNTAKAGLKWCCAGLDVSLSAGKVLSIAELEKLGFTFAEIQEIGAEVKRLATLDPTQESDSS